MVTNSTTNPERIISEKVVYIGAAISVIGLILNFIIILMFKQQEKLRSRTSNMLILNLAIGDILQIIVMTISLNKEEIILCKDMKVIRVVPFMFVYMNAWSVAAMGYKYYKTSRYPFLGHASSLNISVKKDRFATIIVVWVTSFILSLPEFIIYLIKPDKDLYKFLSAWNLICNGVLPITITFVTYSWTFINVVGNVHIAPGGIETYWCKKRSARVLMSLTLVCIICYLPMCFWDLLYTWRAVCDNSKSKIYIYTYYIYLLNVVANPVVMFSASKVFRRYIIETVTCAIFKKRMQATSAVDGVSRTSNVPFIDQRQSNGYYTI